MFFAWDGVVIIYDYYDENKEQISLQDLASYDFLHITVFYS